jgi:hypothetical protein
MLMKNFKLNPVIARSIQFLTLIVFLSSCAFHNGITTSSASLTHNNFEVIGNVQGQAGTKKIFGIGGLSKDALVAEARQNLLKNNPKLDDGEILANITVDFKTTWIIVVSETIVTVTADIIRFNEE